LFSLGLDVEPLCHGLSVGFVAQSLFRGVLLTDFKATYEETSTTALSANPAVAVPLLTINGWILMQRKVIEGESAVTFKQNWAEYRDGFGSAAGNDNYWLGLDKIHRLVRMGSVRLRVEVLKINLSSSAVILARPPPRRPFRISDRFFHMHHPFSEINLLSHFIGIK